jgi:hypothetical protein
MQDQTMPGGWIGLESLNHLVLNQRKGFASTNRPRQVMTPRARVEKADCPAAGQMFLGPSTFLGQPVSQ